MNKMYIWSDLWGGSTFLGFLIIMVLTGCYFQSMVMKRLMKTGIRITMWIGLVLAMGGLGYLLLQRYGLNTVSLSYWFLIYILFLLAIHDLFEKMIPVNILMMALIVGILLGVFNPNLYKLDMILSPVSITVIMCLLSRVLKGGIGKGDILVIAWTSIILGYQSSLSVLLLAILFAGIISGVLWCFKLAKLSTKIPFVPFVFVAALFVCCI